MEWYFFVDRHQHIVVIHQMYNYFLQNPLTTAYNIILLERQKILKAINQALAV